MSAQTFDSALVQKGRLLPGIHGLRGIAALAVVLFHLEHIGRVDPPAFFAFIGRDFGYSVHLFFIVSAFSLMYSTERRTDHPGWVTEYFLKRFFRIAPLFYLIIGFELARQLAFGGIRVSVTDILMNVTFTFGFVPLAGFVWGGWSVGVEMIFYALFPVVLLLIRSHRSALWLVLVTIVTSYAMRTGLHEQHLATNPRPQWDWSYFAFASNVCFFAMGIYVYRLSQTFGDRRALMGGAVPLAALAIIGGLLFFDLGAPFKGGGRLDIVVWGVGLSALCLWQSVAPSIVIANKLFEYLGERSFSIYLLHPIVIAALLPVIARSYEMFAAHIGAYAYFACAALVVGAVLVCAEFTYRLVEVPGINLGRKLIAGRRANG